VENFCLANRSLTGHGLGFALCRHSNATRAPIANPSNSAQLGTRGSLYQAPSYIWVHAVVWAYGCGQTHRQTDARGHNTFASSTTHAKCKKYGQLVTTPSDSDTTINRVTS